MDEKTIEMVNKNYREAQIDKDFLKHYEIYEKQVKQTTQAKIDERKAHVLRQRLIALAVAAALGLGIGIYTVESNSVYRGEPEEPVVTTETSVSYDDFIDYVNEMREQGIQIAVTEEEYQNYVNEVQSTSRGSR